MRYGSRWRSATPKADHLSNRVLDREPRFDRLRARLRRDDHTDRVFAGPAELEKLAVIRETARLCMQQRLLVHVAARIGHLDGHLGIPDAFTALLVVEGDE